MSEETTAIIYNWTTNSKNFNSFPAYNGEQQLQEDSGSGVLLKLVTNFCNNSCGEYVSGSCCECPPDNNVGLSFGSFISSSDMSYVSLFARLESKIFKRYNFKENVSAKLTVSFLRPTGDILYTKEKLCVLNDKKMTKLGFCNLITHSKITEFYNSYPAFKIRFNIECLTSKSLSKSASLIKSNFSKSFMSLLKNETLSDVTLKINNELTIPAHKSILYARSAYFEKMFSHQNIENLNNEVQVNFEEEPFSEVLKFIYTNEVGKMESLAIDIFKIAHYYQIKDLQIICLDFLEKNLIKQKNVMEVLKFANDYEEMALEKQCINLLVRNFNTLKITDNILEEFFKTRPKLSCKLFREALLSNK